MCIRDRFHIEADFWQLDRRWRIELWVIMTFIMKKNVKSLASNDIADYLVSVSRSIRTSASLGLYQLNRYLNLTVISKVHVARFCISWKCNNRRGICSETNNRFTFNLTNLLRSTTPPPSPQVHSSSQSWPFSRHIYRVFCFESTKEPHHWHYGLYIYFIRV